MFEELFRRDDTRGPVNIPLTVNQDGTFFAQIPAEAGFTSVRYKGGWIAFATAWGDTDFRVCALGGDGNVIAPHGEKAVKLANNHRDTLMLPEGTVMVTVEGRVADPEARPGTIPSAIWITDPR